MFILSQFTYNAFRFVELNLHKLVLSNEKQVECDKKLVSENNVKKKNWGGGGGGGIGISPRASNWLETAL